MHEIVVEQKSDSSSSNSADYLIKVNKDGKTAGGNDTDGKDVHGTSNTEASTSINCCNDELVDTKQLKEKIPIDEILYVKLFFCPSNDVLSKNIVIDPILRWVLLFLFEVLIDTVWLFILYSLINEKDEDD